MFFKKKPDFIVHANYLFEKRFKEFVFGFDSDAESKDALKQLSESNKITTADKYFSIETEGTDTGKLISRDIWIERR
mgnify:CR=1 FL=1